MGSGWVSPETLPSGGGLFNSGISPGLGAGLAGISGLAGALGGGINGNQKTSGTQTTTPNLSPLQSSLRDTILGHAANLFSLPGTSGYQSSGLKTIQGQGNTNRNSLRATLAARGLTYSPLAAHEEIANDQNTENQVAQFNNSMPLLKQQLLLQALQGAGGALQESPTGSTVTQQGNINTSGGPSVGSRIGGALGGIGQIVGLLAGLGAI